MKSTLQCQSRALARVTRATRMTFSPARQEKCAASA